jgi:glycosyltransferase involved in cell wall biosynthesis
MRILIVTDAWRPQTNGVVTTLENTIRGVEALGHEVRVLHPGGFRTLPLPGYREIRVAVNPFAIGRRFLDAAPDAVHVATEGPIGYAARRFLRRHGVAFTTSLHTRFPEYARARIGVPLAWGYAALRRFHRPAASTLVTTPSQRDELSARGLENLVVWGRGVDTELFRPRPEPVPANGRVLVHVGRLAVEKNLEAFLDLDVHEGARGGRGDLRIDLVGGDLDQRLVDLDLVTLDMALELGLQPWNQVAVTVDVFEAVDARVGENRAVVVTHHVEDTHDLVFPDRHGRALAMLGLTHRLSSSS